MTNYMKIHQIWKSDIKIISIKFYMFIAHMKIGNNWKSQYTLIELPDFNANESCIHTQTESWDLPRVSPELLWLR